MLEIKNIDKYYRPKGAPAVHALKDISVSFQSKGMVFILGKSGSGKSTFLNVISGLDSFDSGEFIIKGKSSNDFKGHDFDLYRSTYLGFVFQDYNLLDEYTVGQNIALGLKLQEANPGPDIINDALKKVGLEGYADRMPREISGGEKQRAAIARALIKDPEIIMADEPSGALDAATGEQVFKLLKSLATSRLVIVITHDRDYAERYGDRIIEFADGSIVSDKTRIKDSPAREPDSKAGYFNEMMGLADKAGLSKDKIDKLKELVDNTAEADSDTANFFADTKLTEEEIIQNETITKSPFALKRVKLPFRESVGMAWAGIKRKKLRLIVSMILAIIAVSFFGFSTAIGSFDERDLANRVMTDNGYEFVTVEKLLGKGSGRGVSSNIAFSDNDTACLIEITGRAKANYYRLDHKIPSGDIPDSSEYDNAYFSSNYGGLVCSDELNALGLEIPDAYGRFPENDGEILITNYLARHFLANGLKYREAGSEKLLMPEKINDVLSYIIRVADQDLRIVGIVNFKISRYDVLMLKSSSRGAAKNLKSEFSERKRYEISYLFGTSALSERLGLNNSFKTGQLGVSYSLDGMQSAFNEDAYISAESFDSFLAKNDGCYTYLGKDGSNVPSGLKKGEIIINLSQYLYQKSIIDKTGGSKESYLLTPDGLRSRSEALGVFNNGFKLKVEFFNGYLFELGKKYTYSDSKFSVRGVISGFSADGEDGIGILSAEEFLSLTKEGLEEKLFVNLSDTKIRSNFFNNFAGNKKNSEKPDFRFEYTVDFPEKNSIDTLSNLFELLIIIFYVISVVFCVFAVLLILNFISASVSNKKREIGILRALGARRKDVVSIFLMEAIFIAIGIFILSVILVFASVVIFNNLAGSYLLFHFTILQLGILPVLLMLALCFVTVAVASIIPSFRAAGLKPMEAIRAL